MDGARLLAWGSEALRRAAVLRGARSLFVEAAGARLHYLDILGEGEAPTLVVLHGLGGSSLGFSRLLFRLARGARRVMAPDLPGAGFSGSPPGGAAGLAGQLECFEALCEQVVPEPAVFVGNSLGGAMVARFVSRRPERALGAVLVAPAGGRVAAERIAELVRGYRVTTQAEARALARRFFARPPRLLPFLMGPMLLPLMQRPAVQRLLEEALRSSALEAEELQSIRVPLLLLWAAEEHVLPPESLAHFRAHLPGSAQIEEVAGMGHNPHLDSPKALAERILRFCRESQ